MQINQISVLILIPSCSCCLQEEMSVAQRTMLLHIFVVSFLALDVYKKMAVLDFVVIVNTM